MSFSPFSGDDERVPGADQPSPEDARRSEPPTEVMTEVMEADALGAEAGRRGAPGSEAPTIEVGEGADLTMEELAAFDDELAAFDEALETLSDEPAPVEPVAAVEPPASGDVIDDSDVESLPPTEQDSDFNEEIQQWVKTTVPPPSEPDEEALARLDRASDAALAELDADDDDDDDDGAPASKFVPSRRRPDLESSAERVPESSPNHVTSRPPPSSKGSLGEGEPPSLRSLALASVAPEVIDREREPSGDSLVFSSRGFNPSDVSAPPPASFFQVPSSQPATPAVAPKPPRKARDAAPHRAPQPPLSGPPQATPDSPLPSPPRPARVGVAAEARDVAGDSERSIRAPLPARTSPAWLTHLVAFLLGAAVTFVIKDLRTGATPDVASDPKAPATALDRTQSAAAEALPEGDAETEPSDDPPDEAQPNPASSSAWQWPTPDPNAAEPETSASPLPSAAPEPSSASSAAEAGSFDAVAARSALGGLAVSAAGCGDGTTKGKARVAVTFANSGKATVALIQGGPLSGTGVGSCIANILRSAQVPAYSGPITTVFTTVVVQ